MDGVSSVRVTTPSSATASFDSLSNELVEGIGRFLKLRDLGSLMFVDSDRYGALRSRIADIGVKAIDTDLHEGHTIDAFDRIQGLADWLGACNFCGPEDNEICAWNKLLERAADARFDPEQQSRSLRYLMISAWRRIDSEDSTSETLTDQLLELFVRTERAVEQLGEEFALEFDCLNSESATKAHLEKLADYAVVEARGEVPPRLECLMSRWAGICAVRMKVIFLSTSLQDRLKAYHRNLAELERLHPLLPREAALALIRDITSVVIDFPESVRGVLGVGNQKILKSLSKSDKDMMREYYSKTLGLPDWQRQNGGGAPCLLM